ncbi:hypothetical protein [Dactylosporangium matsuzakiense]|nr:hypothetical protein [Dactylosporangium matsuzakiense]UWZ48274.1 hypothetical protein Dmats_18825 [Dactylosporangium matsuzakiense]
MSRGRSAPRPRVLLFWRDSAAIDPLRAAPPEPPVVSDMYLPIPCTVQPEQVREYPYAALLPDGLRERLTAWDGGAAEHPRYQADLSLAPGWKVGGHANWSLTDPYPVDCEACGAAMTLTFTAASSDWHGPHCTWRPSEEPPTASPDTVGVQIGRGYALHVFRCPESYEHPAATAMQ